MLSLNAHCTKVVKRSNNAAGRLEGKTCMYMQGSNITSRQLVALKMTSCDSRHWTETIGFWSPSSRTSGNGFSYFMQDVRVQFEGAIVSKDIQRVEVPKGQETANIDVGMTKSSIGPIDPSCRRIG